MTSRPSPTAFNYARSLLDLAEERRQTHEVAAEVAAIDQALTESPALRVFFSNPSVKQAERQAFIERTLLPTASPLLGAFLQTVASKNRLELLPEICTAFDELLDERLGKVEVDVFVPRRLDPGQLDLVRQRISTAIRKEAVVHQYVDESLIGGIIIKVGDQLIDGSVRGQLQEIERKMTQAS